MTIDWFIKSFHREQEKAISSLNDYAALISRSKYYPNNTIQNRKEYSRK